MPVANKHEDLYRPVLARSCWCYLLCDCVIVLQRNMRLELMDLTHAFYP
jgi:hypothetical protein